MKRWRKSQLKEKMISGFIDELRTPCGKITIEDRSGKKLKFTLGFNPFNNNYDIHDDENSNIVDSINTKTNYKIVIPVDKLQTEEQYNLRFDGGKLEYGSGDEHTTSLVGTFDGYSVGIGAYDPNDELKEEQIWNYSKRKGYLAERTLITPPEYDERNFINYTVDSLEDMTGFTFKIYDYGFEEVCFNVAWIENSEYESGLYESALDFWIS